MNETYQVKSLEEMPRALSYLISKVEALQQDVNNLPREREQVNHLDG